jgi:hypothetical protein
MARRRLPTVAELKAYLEYRRRAVEAARARCPNALNLTKKDWEAILEKEKENAEGPKDAA